MSGIIEVAERVAQLIEHAPAGGIFHDVELGTVAGLGVPGFVNVAGFRFKLRSGDEFKVSIERTPGL